MRPPTPPPAPGPRTAAAFVLVLALGFVGTLLNPALLHRPQASVRDGGWARAYQAGIDAGSPLRPPAAALWNALDLALFRQAPAGVVLGADGWLFSDEEYAPSADPEAARAAWSAHVAAVGARLAADGVHLLVALVPTKASLVDAGQPPLPSAAAARYDQALADLRALGIDAVDLRPALAALGAGAWLRTDTHWTPAGAAAAAAALAARLRAVDAALAGSAAARLEPLGVTMHEGDLVGLLELGPLRAWIGPEPDRLEVSRLVRPPATGADLFAAVTLPVAVVGTSYAADPRWSLAERLEAALGVEVLDAAQAGVGPTRPMAAFLSGPAYRSSRPRAVVWEIPERYLNDPEALAAGAALAQWAMVRP